MLCQNVKVFLSLFSAGGLNLLKFKNWPRIIQKMELGDQQNSGQPQIAVFVAKTYEILKHNEFVKIVFWGNEGNEFIIKDYTKFQEVVLPQYFRHKKFNSFVRQLNMYGFHKTKRDNYRNTFSHPCFLKDRQDLLRHIKRKSKPNQLNQQHPQNNQSKNCTNTTTNTTTITTINGDNRSLLQIESNNRIGSVINFEYESRMRIPSSSQFPNQDQDECVSLQAKIEETSKVIQFQNPSYFFIRQEQN